MFARFGVASSSSVDPRSPLLCFRPLFTISLYKPTLLEAHTPRCWTIEEETPKTWGRGLLLQKSCHRTQTPRMLSCFNNRTYALTCPAAMQIYCNKKTCLNKKWMNFHWISLVRTNMAPFRCFATPIWPPYDRHDILEARNWAFLELRSRKTDTNCSLLWTDNVHGQISYLAYIFRAKWRLLFIHNNLYIFYPTAPCRVQITPKTSTNITRYLYSRGPVRQVSCRWPIS